MLGREDQRRLRELEQKLAAEDAAFARRMREWTAHVPLRDRRWPLVVLLLAALLVVWLGALSVSLPWMVLGLLGVVLAVATYWRQVRRRGRW